MTVTAPDRFDVVLAALPVPTRRLIARRLADGEATVLELAEPFPISLDYLKFQSIGWCSITGPTPTMTRHASE